MNLKDLQNEIKRLNDWYCEKHGFEQGSVENMSRMMLKFGEEYGELCEAVLTERGMQRAHKTEAYQHDDVQNELADVMIVIMTIAENRGISIEEMVRNKLKVVEKRLSE